jgi:hypothetical protein
VEEAKGHGKISSAMTAGFYPGGGGQLLGGSSTGVVGFAVYHVCQDPRAIPARRKRMIG